jgi:hypothetical protein
MTRLDNYDVAEPDVLKDIFLSIYSNPAKKRSGAKLQITQ